MVAESYIWLRARVSLPALHLPEIDPSATDPENVAQACRRYPVQAHEELDGKYAKGFAYWHKILGKEKYNGKTVAFVEEKFDNKLQPEKWQQAAWDRGVYLLKQGVYPIFSFKNLGNANHHCWLGIPEEQYGMQFTTKLHLGLTKKDIQGKQSQVWAKQTKTEILIVTPA